MHPNLKIKHGTSERCGRGKQGGGGGGGGGGGRVITK